MERAAQIERMNIERAGVLITGGSRGLGKELGKALSKAGARVVLVARNEVELAGAVEEIRVAGGEAHGLAFDVGDKEAVHRIAGAAAALVGSIDVLIHCASTLGPVPMPLLVDTECEDLERVLAVNLVGPFRLTKAIAGPMVLKQKGVVIFTSSDAAVSAYERWGAYGVSKAAQDHLARTFAAELAPVRFFAIDPTEMDTKMHADALPDADPKTLARPEDIAKVFVYAILRAEEIPNGSRLIASEWSGK
jgi:NAD(P)-dependent dehydrogenase (short-subunit alcohol dehydrogenase family)